MASSSPNRYLRSRLAYSFLTLSPWHTALTVFLAVLSVSSFLYVATLMPKKWLIIIFAIDVIAAPLMVWCVYAWLRWIPRRVVIPKKADDVVPSHLGGCVSLVTESVLTENGCPVFAYNANNYVGGQSEGRGRGPNLMAKAMAAYFGGEAEKYTYDFKLFCDCYHDEETRLFGPDGKELLKGDYDSPRPYHDGVFATPGDKKKMLPLGGVLAIRMKKAGAENPPYIFFLISTYVPMDTDKPQSDMVTLFNSLTCLWGFASRVLGNQDRDLCVPHLGKGRSHLRESGYSSLWAIVASYRAVFLHEEPRYGLRVCLPPEHIRRYDLREILKIMTLALCSR